MIFYIFLYVIIYLRSLSFFSLLSLSLFSLTHSAIEGNRNTIRGDSVGKGQVTVSMKQRNGDRLYSNLLSVQIFPPLELDVKELFLISGCSFTIGKKNYIKLFLLLLLNHLKLL